MKIIHTPSPHFNERSIDIDSIIIHYTDMPTAERALAWLCDSKSQVSAHYLIDEKGTIYQLIEEDKRAWHAGESYWQGREDLNSCSIGIELANPGHSFGHLPFPEAQIEALITLCQRIQTRWGIPSSRILGHSDVAPRRKQDPGHLFPWDRLAQEGLGLWPISHSEALKHNVTDALAKIGYETTSLPHALFAFQRHFQQHKVDGVADDETLILLAGLI